MDKYHVTLRLEGDNLKFDDRKPPHGFIYTASGAINNGRVHLEDISVVEHEVAAVNGTDTFITFLQLLLLLTPEEAANTEIVLKKAVKDLSFSNYATYISGDDNFQVVAFYYVEGFPDLE
jgi:hypothetical protein